MSAIQLKNTAVAFATELFGCRGVRGIYLIRNLESGFTRLFVVVDNERARNYLQRVMKPELTTGINSDELGTWPKFEETAQEAALSLLGLKAAAFFALIEQKYCLNLTVIHAEGSLKIDLVPEGWQAKLNELRTLINYGDFPASEWPSIVNNSLIFDPVTASFVTSC